MQKIMTLLLAIWLLIVTTAVSADDKVDVNWAGFYFGGEIGGAWSDANWQYQNPNYFNTLGAVLLGTDFDQNASGAIGGVFGGYNFQKDSLVFGLEVSTAKADLQDGKASPFFVTDIYNTDIDWLTKVTGRAGYSWDRWLVYAKVGWAGADVELTLNDPVAQVRANSTEFTSGWTAGAGAEYKLYDNISLGLVYDYINLNTNNESITCPRCGVGVGFGTPVMDSDINIHSIMLRLGIQFPW